jgi:shikimate kinase
MSRRTPNLVLAGFMGTGKSTVGPLLARRLGWPFVDTDALVEQTAGMTVREIFATHGEPAFRALERQALHDAANMERVVMSVGGGALLDPRNRATLQATGVTVLLNCRRDALVRRLEESMLRGERPLLGDDLPGSIETLLKVREPIYALVRLRVDTTHLAPDEVAERVLALYQQAIQHEALA